MAYASKPNLFVVGAAKSGTTSLWEYLRQHPHVYMPEDELYKEPSFFSAYGEGMGVENYLNIFNKATDAHIWLGDSSGAYLTDPESARKIFSFNSESKILIILRDPAERAYSLYNWMVQDGYEYATSFEDALILEETRKGSVIPNWFEPQYYWNYMYFSSGLYYEQVKRYIDLFKEKVLILKFDELKRNPKEVFDKICYFLGIEPLSIVFKEHNVSRAVASSKIQFALRHLNGFINSLLERSLSSPEARRQVRDYYRNCFRKLSIVTRITLRERIISEIVLLRILSSLKNEELFEFRDIVTKKQRDMVLTFGFGSGKPASLSHKTKQILSRKYSADILKLSILIGIDFSEWLPAV